LIFYCKECYLDEALALGILLYHVGMDIDIDYEDQVWNSIRVTASGWILIGDVSFTMSRWILALNTKTRDVSFTASGWILAL
jgi:hypothetical protein